MKRRTLLEKLKIKEIRISENRPLINNFSLEITFLSFLKTKIILISNDLSQINYYKDKTKAINTTETWVVLSRTHRKRYLGCCDVFLSMGLQENREQYFSSAQDQQWYGITFFKWQECSNDWLLHSNRTSSDGGKTPIQRASKIHPLE